MVYSFFIKLPVCYLEHLDPLGLRNANRLKIWVGGYKLNRFLMAVYCKRRGWYRVHLSIIS
jgi:hypothetical protein